MDLTEKLLGLIEINERLADLLHKENSALREKRGKDAVQYLGDKNELVRIYESRVKGLPKGPEAMDATSPELRDKLRLIGEKVNLMIEENGRLLKITIDANRRVVELVAEAVKLQRRGPGIYSANGLADGGKRSSAPQNLAISVNQSL